MAPGTPPWELGVPAALAPAPKSYCSSAYPRRLVLIPWAAVAPGGPEMGGIGVPVGG